MWQHHPRALSLVVVLLMTTLLTDYLLAQSWGPRHGESRSRGETRRRVPRDYESEQIATGYFFTDGKYVPPPYTVSFVDGATSINGMRVGDARASGFSPEILAGVLIRGEVLLQFADNPIQPWTFDEAGLDILRFLGDEDRGAATTKLLEQLPPDYDADLWKERLRGLDSAVKLRQRANDQYARTNAVVQANLRASAAALRLNSFQYFFSTLGTVLTVIGFGHLLSNPPNRSEAPSPETMAGLRRMVVLSVGLLVVMSGFDFVWTLLAYQAGHMKELNPIGSALIKDPVTLLTFKAVATLIPGAILLALRNSRFAQLAAWWTCLVLTLVTARWVVFNSLFMG